ncbi:DUF3592 domain-containing protein [Alteromonas gracilis]|uniref:DUF3592 domain-containing protein n=1 Tax=Alteromonas gracilis TaxID=1479524 RepID=A0ABX5CPQ1_9ALTE|nr:DUF3592 domain-containing protein [Alteromonas gracilis]PRO69564.1 hypothetical protein C6Y39_06265 [Alteromonas gracilis]
MDILNYFQQMVDLASEGELQGIWFWASCYMLVVCLYSAYFQIRTRFWATTVGNIHNLGLKKFGISNDLSEQQYRGKALYSYSVNGQTYEGTRISPWVFVTNYNAKGLLLRQQAGIDMPTKDTVTVYYNPNKPQKSFLLKASKFGILVTLTSAVAPFLGYVSRFYA